MSQDDGGPLLCGLDDGVVIREIEVLSEIDVVHFLDCSVRTDRPEHLNKGAVVATKRYFIIFFSSRYIYFGGKCGTIS
jgi:hypothetical protein